MSSYERLPGGYECALRGSPDEAGTAEEQYREWRTLLHQMYLEESGMPADAPPDAPVPSAQPVALDLAH